MKQVKLKCGSTRKILKIRNQSIAIGLSEVRAAGTRVSKKSSAKKKLYKQFYKPIFNPTRIMGLAYGV